MHGFWLGSSDLDAGLSKFQLLLSFYYYHLLTIDYLCMLIGHAFALVVLTLVNLTNTLNRIFVSIFNSANTLFFVFSYIGCFRTANE